MDLSCYNLPNDVLAKKLKNDLFDKLVSCTSEQEVQDKLVEIVREKINNGLIDPQKIRTLDSVGDAVTLLYACSVEEQLPNFADVDVSVSDALQEVVSFICNLPHFELPELAFQFPDLHEGIIDALVNSLLQFAIQLLISLMSELLEIIIDFCNNGASSLTFGAANLIDIIEKSISKVNNLTENINDFLNTVFSLFGINFDGTIAQIEQLNPDVCVEDQIATSGKNVQNFLNDISFSLTPSEICSLINSNPTNETIEIIKEIIEFEYPQFMTVLNTNDKIVSLFSTLGRIVDPKICDKLESIGRNPNVCVSEEADKLRESFLARKQGLDDLPLTNEQIKNELEKERKRNKDRFERVAETVIAIKRSPNSVFENAQKSLFCSNNTKGIFTMKMAPVLTHSAKKIINKTFGQVQTNFLKESNNFSTLFVKTDRVIDTQRENGVLVPKTIPKYTNFILNGRIVKNVLNPEFVQATAVYPPVYCDELGNTSVSDLEAYGYETTEDDGGTESIDIQTTESNKRKRKLIRIIKYKVNNSLIPSSINSINSIESQIIENFSTNSISLIYNNTSFGEQKKIVLKME